MWRKLTYMTHLKFKHASTHVRTPRVVREKEEDRVIQCKELKKRERERENEAALCTIWNKVFSSEFLLEGVMKYLLPSSLLIFPICLYCCSQPASLLEFNSVDLVNLCGRERVREREREKVFFSFSTAEPKYASRSSEIRTPSEQHSVSLYLSIYLSIYIYLFSLFLLVRLSPPYCNVHYAARSSCLSKAGGLVPLH